MDENPYQAPQTHELPVDPPVSRIDRWPYVNAIVTCLVSGTFFGVVANLLFELDGKGAQLTNAVGLGVWATAILLGLLEYRRAARRTNRPGQ